MKGYIEPYYTYYPTATGGGGNAQGLDSIPVSDSSPTTAAV